MARSHPAGKPSRSLNWLIRRLNDNYSFIGSLHRDLNRDVMESFPTAPSAEWLLDNFYIIEEQVKLIKGVCQGDGIQGCLSSKEDFTRVIREFIPLPLK